MDPKIVFYVNSENIVPRAEIVSHLVNNNFHVLVSGSQPSLQDTSTLEGLIFDPEGKGYLASEWQGSSIMAIVWYNWGVINGDLIKLIPFFESLFKMESYRFNYEDRLLEEYTKPSMPSLPLDVC